MEGNTLIIVGGFIVHLLAVASFFMRVEHRLTKLETLVSIDIKRQGIKLRANDQELTIHE